MNGRALMQQRTSSRRGRLIAILGAIGALALFAFAATASAATTWSAPRTIDNGVGQTMAQITCPTAGQCTALDVNGRAVAYNPTTAKAGAPVQVAQGQPAIGASCPTATQCTVVTPVNRAYTYNPAAAKQGPAQQLEAVPDSSGDGPTVEGVACPSSSLCVAGDTNGNVITFAPGSSVAAKLTSLGSGEWNAIACPSTTQCTVAGQNVEATFNPAAPAGAARVKVEPSQDDIIDLSCPSATQCTALDAGGGEVTFNPQTPPMTLPDRALVSNNTVEAITCVAATQCTTIGGNAKAATFNPTLPTPTVTNVTLEKPGLGGSVVGQGEGIQAVACSSTTACVAVDAVGQAINFNPTSAGSAKPVKIDGGTPLLGVSCPSTGQCTAIGPFKQYTFNPLKAKAKITRGVVVTDHFFNASGIACASPSLCLGVVTGHQATFNPRKFKTPKLRQLAAFTDAAIVGLSCPTTTECVASDTDGYGISYNPTSGKFIKRRIKVEAGEALTGSACSSKTQCTAIDNDGNQITFNPLTGKTIASASIDASVGLDAPSGDSDNELNAISCPGAKLCVAVDTRGAAVSFNPRSKRKVKPTMIDPGEFLTSVSCPTTKRCVAVDDAGQVLSGAAKPATWKVAPLTGAAGLLGVDCPTAKECVAVDAAGDAFVGKG
jgi:hypothetical protein